MCGCAYPFGICCGRVVKILKFELTEKFISLKDVCKPQLFYLWGHSYECNDDNNWDRIEKFCEMMGNREDIWYAANIEICDYVKAYNSLLVSYDGKRIYNPTLIDMWMSDDTETGFMGRKTYCIKSGETLVLK